MRYTFCLVPNYNYSPLTLNTLQLNHNLIMVTPVKTNYTVLYSVIVLHLHQRRATYIYRLSNISNELSI